MTQDRLISLMMRRLSGNADSEETQELEQWSNETEENKYWLEKNLADGYLEKEVAVYERFDPEAGFLRWSRDQRKRRKAQVMRLSGLAAAACVFVVILTGVLFDHPTGAKSGSQRMAVVPEIRPGRNTATLILSNGQQVLLDDVGKGVLGIQGSSKIIKADNGSLKYQRGQVGAESVVYNMLRTPRSGQYKLELPDGTEVWLNNETSLKYPTSFRGKERVVELNGEAYFEVASLPNQPFVVKVRDEDIKVLGTNFNVMSYSEEGGTQTTLLKGAVAVKTNSAEIRLRPDEQAEVKADGSLDVAKDVASQDIVSWKDGFFYFGRSSFPAVMRQLARWYDVDVVYEGKVPETEFVGKIDRSRPLNDLIDFFSQNQIHLRLEGRKLIVLSN